MRLLFLLGVCLLASTVEAGPITASHAPGLLTATSAPNGLWFEGDDFLLMIYADPGACCEPTTRNQTRGLHIESVLADGRFRVDIPASLLANACGFLQIDAQSRLPNGGLSDEHWYGYYNTERTCAPSRDGVADLPPFIADEALTSFNSIELAVSLDSTPGPSNRFDDYPSCTREPCIVPTPDNGYHPPVTVPPATSVPETSASWFLLVISLLIFHGLCRVFTDRGETH